MGFYNWYLPANALKSLRVYIVLPEPSLSSACKYIEVDEGTDYMFLAH